jgi:hypothetical protein
MSRMPQKGPVEIVAVVRSTEGQIHLDANRDARKLFSIKPILTPSGTTIHNAQYERDGLPGTTGTLLTQNVPREEWVTLTIVIKEETTEVRLEGEGARLVRVPRVLELSKPGKVGLKALGELEVRSFEVKPYKP